MGSRKVGIIGAGPAGSAAANALARQGFQVTVFEKEPYTGGRSYSHRQEGFVLDTGAGFITNFYRRVFELATSEGFDKAIEPLSRVSGLVKDGKLATLDIGSTASFFRFPWVSFTEKLRMAGWSAAMTKRRWQLDIASAATLAKYDSDSIAAYIQKKLGHNVYQHFIRPAIEPFWYYSCEQASEALVRGLTAHAAGAKFYALPDGIDQICTGLLNGVDVMTGCEVTHLSVEGEKINVSYRCCDSIQQCSSVGGRGGGYSGADSASVNSEALFDSLIIATTAPVAKKLAASLPVEWLSEMQRSYIESQRYSSNIHAVFKVASFAEKGDMSSVFPCGPGEHPVAAISFVSAKQVGAKHRGRRGQGGGDELISIYLSDKESKRRLADSDETIYAYCWQKAKSIYPDLPQRSTPFHLSRRSEAIPIPEPGRYRAAKQFLQVQNQLAPPVLFCGDYLATATLEGAIATGLEAAKTVSKTF